MASDNLRTGLINTDALIGINSTDRVLELNLGTDQTIYAHMKKPLDTMPPLNVTNLHNTSLTPSLVVLQYLPN